MAASKDEPSWRANGASKPKRDETPFKRFEDLTRRLLGVSKRELDEKGKT
jgi:hypothetical protein